jgi:vanillate O-demethylase ferredoxin subunit
VRYETEWVTATVTAICEVAPGLRELRLKAEGAGAAYPTGSHVQVRVLIDGRPELRHYSLIGDRPMHGSWRIAVKQEQPGRGGSRYIWSLAIGARIEVSRPGSQFELSSMQIPRLLIAGGIGVTPIFGMAEALQRRRHPFRMLYAGRSRAAMAFLSELTEICGDTLYVAAEDELGRPDIESEISRLPPDGEAYVCGPIGLLEATRRYWRAAGRDPARLIYESFGTSGRHPTEAFRVRLPRLKVDIDVPPDNTILEALEAAGVGVLSDCRRGECGLCQMTVLAIQGELDHRDVFFSEEQHLSGGMICTCVSRVAGGGCITLDPAWRGDQRLRSGVELRRKP